MKNPLTRLVQEALKENSDELLINNCAHEIRSLCKLALEHGAWIHEFPIDKEIEKGLSEITYDH
jgi:hypothetical protein